MKHSTSEKMAYFEYNKKVFQAIKEGSLSDDFLNSKLYLSNIRFLAVIIIILEPLTYKEIKELALMIYKAFVIKVKSVDLDTEIDNTWEKYRQTFQTNFKARIPGIIEIGYLKFDLDETNLGTGHGSTIPLNLEAFTQMYQTIDPLWFPKSYEEFFLAIKRIERKLQNSTEQSEKENIQKTEALEKKQLLSIPTKATSEQILNFWLKLQGNNEKGEPYWECEQEIDHFVNQNFEGFSGVDEIKEFTPKMNKTEFYQVTWFFFKKYGESKTKRLYANLLLKNFTQFKNAEHVYSNIKDQSKKHLKEIFQ